MGEIGIMEKELEIVSYPQIKYCNLFMLSMNHRSPHMHREFELILQFEGSMEIKFKHERCVTHSPSLILLNTNQIHEIFRQSERLLLLILQISPPFFANTYPLIANLAFDRTVLNGVLCKEDFSHVLTLFTALGRHYFGKESFYEFSCAAILHTLFGRLLHLLPHHILSDDEKESQRQKARRINRILNYIDENFTGKILLSDIAERENLSLYYLSHFFKENLNQSFQRYISALRFNQARKLLAENKNISLLDVCFQSGYSDYRYLQRAFADRLKCTPAEYRRHLADSEPSCQMAECASEDRWSPEASFEFLNRWAYANKCLSSHNACEYHANYNNSAT